mmetsp:Transcript_71017/g.197272  ORF Transcript_71017/g.197272 Transcript_71017/m.197272 type:complete len:214 (-) Transcript_71017:1176-1817(-)
MRSSSCSRLCMCWRMRDSMASSQRITDLSLASTAWASCKRRVSRADSSSSLASRPRTLASRAESSSSCARRRHSWDSACLDSALTRSTQFSSASSLVWRFLATAVSWPSRISACLKHSSLSSERHSASFVLFLARASRSSQVAAERFSRACSTANSLSRASSWDSHLSSSEWCFWKRSNATSAWLRASPESDCANGFRNPASTASSTRRPNNG